MLDDKNLSKSGVDKRRDIDTTRVVISAGRPTNRGTGLGKVEQVTWTLKKLRAKFAEPLVDVNTPWSKYLKLQKIAKDLDHPKHKEAANQILGMKMSAGNWTAARYEGKSRKVTDIVAKTMLVLDIDHANHDQVLDIRSNLTPVSEFYWLAHTSRSHYPEKPKFRMAFPVSREMKPDEAHAVLRHLSTYLLDDPEEAIEIVDTVTFRPNQTMFWPSISKGQDYWCDENLAGDILDVDEFLARNPGWEDFVTLPYQVGEKKQGLKDPSAKMENPLEKPEPIGAFCRTYRIEDAIETFLPEIYTPSLSASDVRYNYEPGSGLNGAVVYDDGLFLLSQHGTDPASGLHNAFDLVRLHKFGHLDQDTRENTNPGNLPSFKAMVEFCRQLPEVVAEEFSALNDVLDDLDDDEDDEHDSASGDFELDGSDAKKKSGDLSDELDDLPDEDPDVDDLLGEEKPKKEKKKADREWFGNLIRKANGDLEPRLNNAELICSNDPRISKAVAYIELTLDPVALKPIRAKKMTLASPPLERLDRERGFRPWTDGDDISIKRLMSAPETLQGYGVEMPRSTIEEAVLIAGKKNSFHPLRDEFLRCHKLYLESGKATEGAIEQIPQRFLGCPDDEFHRQSSLYLMLGMVARTFEPGCKFDIVVIIRGTQGGGKGLFWDRLANGYFVQLPTRFDDVSKMVEAMKGNLVGELGEMAGLRRDTAEIAKDFITRTKDQLRLAYGRRAGVYPRQCIMVGTSNLDAILHDPTGNRRFLIWVDTHDEDNPIDLEGLEELRPMLWGEAYDRYLQMREKQPYGNLRLDLHSAEARRQRDAVAENFRKRTATEDIADALRDWLDERKPAHEVMVDESGLTLERYEGDETPMVRNLVNANMAWGDIKNHPAVDTYRHAGAHTCGSALTQIEELTPLGRCRRHGQRANWFCRFRDGPLWVPAPEEEDEPADDIDDLLS